jgi:CubicO group peptidase (beta-lactamase class C family)
MKKHLLSLFFSLFLASQLPAQALYFPPTAGNAWDTVSPASLGWCEAEIDTLIDYLDSQDTKAFIVLKGGKIAIEHYFGTFTQDSIWYWASAGKTLTAFTTGIALQEGLLALNDKSSDYLGTGWTVCPSAKEDLIQVVHQLSMTSGLDDGVPDEFCTLDTCLQYLTDAGTRWAYHNGPYTLLDGVLSNATGMSLNSYVTQKIKTPTGMSGIFVQSGYNNIFYSKPRSAARFGLLLLNRGTWNNTPVLTDTTYFNQMTNTSQPHNLSYGYLTWLNGKASYKLPGAQFNVPGMLAPSAPADMYCAMGKNGQFIDVVPSQQIVLIRMGDSPSGALVPAFLNDSIWARFSQVLQPCTTTVQTAAPIAAKFQLYPNPTQGGFRITLANETFDLRILNAQGQTVFQYKDLHDKFEFDPQSSPAQLPAGLYHIQVSTLGTPLQTRILLVQ